MYYVHLILLGIIAALLVLLPLYVGVQRLFPHLSEIRSARDLHEYIKRWPFRRGSMSWWSYKWYQSHPGQLAAHEAYEKGEITKDELGLRMKAEWEQPTNVGFEST